MQYDNQSNTKTTRDTQSISVFVQHLPTRFFSPIDRMPALAW
jgi:hypothetical protein